MNRLRAEALHTLVARACMQMGAREEDGLQVASSLVRANLCGYDSHGVVRLAQYHKWWKAGLLNPAAQPVLVSEAAFAAKIDGRRAFGQVAANFASQLAIGKAHASGITVVTGQACGHVGRLADHAEAIQEAGLIGLVAVNDPGAQCVVPWGGIEPRLGTNPIAMGVPGGAAGGILFDFSTSAAALGTVRQLFVRGEPAPPGWLIDVAGRETQEPACLFTDPRGALLPAGGHRGFALGLAVEVLAGILSGAGFSHPDPAPEEMGGLFILALDVARFLPLDQFRARVDQMTAYIKSARPVPGGRPIYIPGERSRQEAVLRSREGIALDKETWARVAGVLEELGLYPLRTA